MSRSIKSHCFATGQDLISEAHSFDGMAYAKKHDEMDSSMFASGFASWTSGSDR
jgi:hypothetical protein